MPRIITFWSPCQERERLQQLNSRIDQNPAQQSTFFKDKHFSNLQKFKAKRKPIVNYRQFASVCASRARRASYEYEHNLNE